MNYARLSIYRKNWKVFKVVIFSFPRLRCRQGHFFIPPEVSTTAVYSTERLISISLKLIEMSSLCKVRFLFMNEKVVKITELILKFCRRCVSFCFTRRVKTFLGKLYKYIKIFSANHRIVVEKKTNKLFTGVGRSMWGHELASSFRLFRLHKFFLQM